MLSPTNTTFIGAFASRTRRSTSSCRALPPSSVRAVGVRHAGMSLSGALAEAAGLAAGAAGGVCAAAIEASVRERRIAAFFIV